MGKARKNRVSNGFLIYCSDYLAPAPGVIGIQRVAVLVDEARTTANISSDVYCLSQKENAAWYPFTVGPTWLVKLNGAGFILVYPVINQSSADDVLEGQTGGVKHRYFVLFFPAFFPTGNYFTQGAVDLVEMEITF
jgi:hypothetical protein